MRLHAWFEGSKRGRELQGGEPLVRERSCAAVMLPALGVAQPVVGIFERGFRYRVSGSQSAVESPGGITVVMAGETMVLARPAGNLASEKYERSLFGLLPTRLRGQQGRRQQGKSDKRTARQGRRPRGEANGPDSVQGQELGDRVLDLFQLDWLDQYNESVAGRQLVLDRVLAGAEQDQGHEGMAVLVGLLMHVRERLDGLGAEPVGIEDHGVSGRLPVPFGRALGVAYQQDAVAHARQVLPQRILDLGLGLDAEDIPGQERLGLMLEGIADLSALLGEQLTAGLFNLGLLLDFLGA